MSLNWKEIDKIMSEWNFVGGKVQQMLQPSPHQLFLEIYTYQPHNDAETPALQFLAIDLTNREVRMHLTQNRIKKPKKPQRFQQLLQARLVGARILSIEHLNQDRIVRFVLEKQVQDDNSQETQTLHLYVRLWSNQANILLCKDDDYIIDLAFRRPQQRLMPGNIFELPTKNENKRTTEIRDWDDTQYNSFNEYIEKSYKNTSRETQRHTTFQQIHNAIEQQIAVHTQTLEKTKKQIETYQNTDKLEHYGNLILSHQHLIQSGQNNLEIQDDNEVLIIPMEKKRNAIENAEWYFNKAKKAKRSLEFLKVQQARAQEIIAMLKALQERITEDNVLLSDEEKKLVFPKAKTLPQQEQKVNQSEIKVLFKDGDYTFIVGRNAKENDALLRKHIKGNDMWLHVRGNSGAYVFIRCPRNKTIPLDKLMMGGQLAAFYSKCKNESYADIYYTEMKYLKKIKNSPGLVNPMRSKNLQIKIDLEKTKSYMNTHLVPR